MAIKDNLQPFWGFNVQGITKDDGSANDAFISSLQSELDKTELDLYSSKLETYLDTANGRWLDYWGRWLGLHRDNRSDDDYRTALINHVLHERNTIPALTKALSDFLKINQDHIYIYEPWRDMFVWNASHYNTHKFFTDPYYRYAVIDIQIEGPYSDIVNEIINLFRPAGVYWVVTSLVNVVNNTAPILDLSVPTTQIIESSDTDYANFAQTNSAYLNSKLDLATYVGDPFNYNKDNLNAGKQYATSNSSYNPVVYIGSNKEDYDTIINPDGGVNLYTDTQNFDDPAVWALGSYSSWTKTTDTYKGLAVMQTTQNWGGLGQFIQVKKGDVLTYSVYARYTSGTGTSVIGWNFVNNIPNVNYSPATVNITSFPGTITDSWQRISGTIVATSDGYVLPQFERGHANTNTLQIAGIKVEKGSVAHDWSPNPSDSTYDSWLQAKRLEYYSTTVETTDTGTNLFRGYPTNNKLRVNQNNSYYYDYPFKGKGTRILLKPNTEYTVTWNYEIISGGMDSTEIVSVGRGNEQYDFAIDGVNARLSDKKVTIKTPADVSDNPYLALRFSRTRVPTTSVIDYWDIAIREGATATPWSPNPSDSGYDSWLQAKQQAELGITSQNLKQQLGSQITTQPTVISSIDSQSSSFTVDQTQTSLLGGVDLLGYLTVYKQAVKSSEQTAKQFILANLANSNTQRLELVLQNQANIDLTQDVRLELYDYNLHLWVKPIIEYEVHSDYTIFKVSLSSIAPYLSDGGNFMFQVWPTVANITTLSVNYLGYLFNAPSDIITLANSAETFTMETN